jgi:hypothetical protein
VSPEPLYPSLLRPTQTLRLAVSELASARRAAADGRLDSAHELLRSARTLVQSAERSLESALASVERRCCAHRLLMHGGDDQLCIKSPGHDDPHSNGVMEWF